MPLPPDGFIAAFLPSGERYWGSYLGKAKVDVVTALKVDMNGSLLVGGYTTNDSMGTPGAHKPYIGDPNADGLLAVYSQAAQQSFTYFGGSALDVITGIASNNANQVYITGRTQSSNGIAINSSTSRKGNAPDNDAFLAKFSGDNGIVFRFVTPLPGNPPAVFCPGVKTAIPYTLENNHAPVFQAGNVFTMQLSDASGSFANPVVVGTGAATEITIPMNTPPGNGYKIRAISSKPLMISQSTDITVSKIPYPQITISDTEVCTGDEIYLLGTDTTSNATYHWMVNNTIKSTIKSGDYITDATSADSGMYIFTATTDGCSASDTINIHVYPYPVIDSISNTGPVCEPGNILLYAAAKKGSPSYTWEGPMGFVGNYQAASLMNMYESESGLYIVTVTEKGCSVKDTTEVLVNPTPAITEIGSNSPVCLGDTIQLHATISHDTVSFAWTGPGGFYSVFPNPMILNISDSNKGVYKLLVAMGECKDTAEVTVDIAQPFTIEAGSNSPVTAGQELILFAGEVAGAAYMWTGPNGFTSAERNPALQSVTKAAAGPYTVIASRDNCHASAATIVTVIDPPPGKPSESIFPNPNDGSFTVKLVMKRDQDVPCTVYNRQGQKVYSFKLESKDKLVEEKVTLPGYLSAGVYTLRMNIDGDIKAISFVIKK